MRTKVLAVMGSMLLAASSLLGQSSQTIRGFVSDADCGSSHRSPGEDVSRCVKSCIKHGSAAVLVSKGKVYELRGDTAAVTQYAGQNVTVKGTVSGDVVTVASVTPAKS